MQITYEEGSNIISMRGVLPTTDATGKVRLNEGEYFDFTVSSTLTGNSEINWEIVAEDFSNVISTTFGSFLNNEFLTSYLETGQSNMIVDSSTWYLGMVLYGDDYRLAKYDDVANITLTSSTVTAKVGLLRLGELGASTGESMYTNGFVTLTAIYVNSNMINYINYNDNLGLTGVGNNVEVRPAMFLKDTVTIASGTGTKDDLFVLSN